MKTYDLIPLAPFSRSWRRGTFYFWGTTPDPRSRGLKALSTLVTTGGRHGRSDILGLWSHPQVLSFVRLDAILGNDKGADCFVALRRAIIRFTHLFSGANMKV